MTIPNTVQEFVRKRAKCRCTDNFIQKSRQLWVKGGFHPPPEDPRQEM